MRFEIHELCTTTYCFMIIKKGGVGELQQTINTSFLLQITLKFRRYFQSIEFFFVNLQVIKGYRDAYEARIEERAG